MSTRLWRHHHHHHLQILIITIIVVSSSKLSSGEGNSAQIPSSTMASNQDWGSIGDGLSHTSHIISAYMQIFPNTNHPNYRHAGELVEVLLDLEETKSPSWDVTELMAWFLLAPDISTLPPPPSSSSSVKRRSTKTTTHLQQRLFDSIMPPGATAAATSTTTTKDDLVNEALRLVAKVRCKICFYQEANILTLHCAHVFLCTDCAQRQKPTSMQQLLRKRQRNFLSLNHFNLVRQYHHTHHGWTYSPLLLNHKERKSTFMSTQ